MRAHQSVAVAASVVAAMVLAACGSSGGSPSGSASGTSTSASSSGTSGSASGAGGSSSASAGSSSSSASSGSASSSASSGSSGSAGSGTSGSSAGSAPALPKGSGTTLKLYEDKGAWDPFFKQMGQLSAKQINVPMQPVGYTDENTYTAFIKASLRTNVKPDLFTWHTGAQLEDLVQQGALADTSSIWSQAVSQGYLTKQLEPYFTVKGKQYCVPLNVSYWGMF